MKRDEVRHPTKKSVSKATHSVPIISCGKQESELLIYLLNNHGRFNLKQYSREKNVPRSTVYDKLNSLKAKGFVERELANNIITERGKIYLEATNRGVGSSRQECRKEQLSTHWHKFTLEIENKKNFYRDKLKEMGAIEIKENNLKNLNQIIAKFGDATIIINPKQVRINLYDIVSKNSEDSELESLNRVLEYTEKLRKLGLRTSGIMLEDGHWARVESQLSDFLYKVDKRYFLELDDGSKFWIDCSNNKKEDETNNKEVRERVDNFLLGVGSGKYDVSKLNEINEIKDCLSSISKLEVARLSEKIEEGKMARLKLEKNSTMENISINKFYDYIN